MLKLAALAGFLAVALGAFGAHGLSARLDGGMMAAYRTGVLYHLVHAVALLTLALAEDRLRWARTANIFFLIGIALFSGSLYGMAITGQLWLGRVTPFGGVSFLAGWLLLALGHIRKT